ncbi:hypothetical protein NDU88_002289 [Pleurodeles waltl]|uniref:Uncharacterized protein n=1 Tax=Pleurodeles waltl TaxID=8319 RepID=A0AAV7NMP0_PLEWA|nr:hypothetical protein NDU88_002289 [Pleurodeles waltl]
MAVSPGLLPRSRPPSTPHAAPRTPDSYCKVASKCEHAWEHPPRDAAPAFNNLPSPPFPAQPPERGVGAATAPLPPTSRHPAHHTNGAHKDHTRACATDTASSRSLEPGGRLKLNFIKCSRKTCPKVPLHRITHRGTHRWMREGSEAMHGEL